MSKKILSAFTLMLILIGMSGVVSKVLKAEAWAGTVHIKADGSIDPADAPIITHDNMTYTLTDNIMSSGNGIVVERDNTVVDGAGYAVQGKSAYKSKGIDLNGRSNVTVKTMEVCNFYYGIYFSKSLKNNIKGNNITNNTYGIDFCGNSHHNTIAGNNITNNSDGVYLFGGSSENNISGNNIRNNLLGIEFEVSPDNDISANNITNNMYGLYLFTYSHNNSIVGNNVTENSQCGLYLYWSSYNAIFHNNFIDNKNQADADLNSLENYWDNGVEGNYWIDYTGFDSDYDGIGDSWYEIDSNNVDRCPLMGMFSSFNTSYGYSVNFVSNSSISDVSFNLSPIEVYPPEAILAFNVSGDSGTDGFLRVCIPKVLINGSYIIIFDYEIITNTTWPQARELPCSNETHVYFYINYTHSEHTIIITGTTIIPEFQSLHILLFFTITTVLAVIVYKRKRHIKR